MRVTLNYHDIVVNDKQYMSAMILLDALARLT